MRPSLRPFSASLQPALPLEIPIIDRLPDATA